MKNESSLDESRFCIFVPSYNTEKYIENTISRIPWGELPKELSYRVVFVDNKSTDNTWQRILKCQNDLKALGIDSDAIQNPRNLGYGGSKKVIFNYCINNDFGLLGVLHSDGQYLPEELPRLIREFLAHPDCALLYGSRLMGSPLEGGMPRYKYFGNIVLTWIQNLALGSIYSEFHSGYKIFRMNKIRGLPYHHNSDYFDFSSQIMFQVHHSGGGIVETYIPTFYGDMKSHVGPIRMPLAILATAFSYVLHKWGLIRVRRFSND
jgi:glycosyltransferase involved in cell wall biosynthesis